MDELLTHEKTDKTRPYKLAAKIVEVIAIMVCALAAEIIAAFSLTARAEYREGVEDLHVVGCAAKLSKGSMNGLNLFH